MPNNAEECCEFIKFRLKELPLGPAFTDHLCHICRMATANWQYVYMNWCCYFMPDSMAPPGRTTVCTTSCINARHDVG